MRFQADVPGRQPIMTQVPNGRQEIDLICYNVDKFIYSSSLFVDSLELSTYRIMCVYK